MNHNEEIIELDLKALLFYILRQWKLIVIIAVVVAVLLGSVMAVNEHSKQSDADYWEEHQKYQDQLMLYEAQIEATQTRIDNLQEYMNQSVLMKADHRNMYIAKATYYIDSGYQILPEYTYQNPDKTGALTWHYNNYLQDYSMYEVIAADVGMEAKYLMELVSVSYENDGATLAITVKHSDMDAAQNIMKILQQKLQDVCGYLNTTIHEHTLTLMMDTLGAYVDEDVKETQEDSFDELIKHEENLIKQKEKRDQFEKDNAPGDLNVIKAFVKWCLVGGVIGGVMVAAFFFVLAIVTNRIHSADQLASVYHLPVVGELIAEKGAKNPVVQMLDKWEGRASGDLEDNLCLMAANIKHFFPNAKRILISGDHNEHISEKTVDLLKKNLTDVELILTGSPLNEAHALRQLATCDAVVLLAVRDRSKNQNLGKTIRLLHEGGKTAVGFMFVY